MLLSEIVGKNVYAGKALRGVCRGVCLSLKSRAVNTCCAAARRQRATTTPNFSVGVGCVGAIDDAVVLRRMRTAIPKNCARFFAGRPVYSEDGAYLGIASDLAMENFVATRLITDTGKNLPCRRHFPRSETRCCSNAPLSFRSAGSFPKASPFPTPRRAPS